MPIQFFDGHNDVLFRLSQYDQPDPETLFLNGRPDGHIDLPRARNSGMVGGFFALYAESLTGLDFSIFEGGAYHAPLPAQVPRETAWDAISKQIVILKRIIAQSDGAVRLCTSAKDVLAARDQGQLAIILHMEGAEAIDADLNMLDILYELGLRSLGPVWSRPTIFAHGVPMAFPSTPDIGDGLTEAGVRLVKACNQKGMMIDLSHLNEAGFWDVAKLSDAPLIATHSNVHNLCPSSRNLTDKQLDAIRDSDGLVGVNLATCFLRDDGKMTADTPLALVLDHFMGLVERLGEDRVALGSDFDGAVVPQDIADVTGVSLIFDGLRDRGVNDKMLQKLAFDNWVRIASSTFKQV